MLLRHCQAAQRCPSVYIWGEELEESGSEESSVVVKCLLKTLTRSGGCAHTFTGDYTGCVPQWKARVQHVFCVQEMNFIKKTKKQKYTLCCFFFPQDHLGLKVRKASWDAMEKSAPAELKVNHKCRSLLHKWLFHTCKLLLYFYFYFTFPGLKGDIGDPGPRGPNGDPGCNHSPKYIIFCFGRPDLLKTSLSTEQEFHVSAHR